ncbi:MAG: hypothetical protein IVW56_13870 [Candidatus Binataceae bacterium]|nr:hypothetical protein [Candidatus Binataceae bacterium]
MIFGAAALAVALVAGFAVYQMHSSAAAGTTAVRITLDPAGFAGDTKQAYVVAEQHPELLAQLDCYCGCEEHEGHKSLLDCFRTNHGAGCDICVGEAVTAGKMLAEGTPVDQIRQALRARYGHGG